MEDSLSSLSSGSTLSCEPLVGGSTDLEAGFLSSSITRTSSTIRFSDLNPYALSSPRRSGFIASRNRRLSHRRFLNEFSEYDIGSHHFLDYCFLCKKPLSGKADIFMYRDLPFCTEECRSQQIDMDEMQEGAKSVALRTLTRRELQKEEHQSTRKELQKEEHQSSPRSQKARAGSIQLAG